SLRRAPRRAAPGRRGRCPVHARRPRPPHHRRRRVVPLRHARAAARQGARRARADACGGPRARERRAPLRSLARALRSRRRAAAGAGARGRLPPGELAVAVHDRPRSRSRHRRVVDLDRLVRRRRSRRLTPRARARRRAHLGRGGARRAAPRRGGDAAGPRRAPPPGCGRLAPRRARPWAEVALVEPRFVAEGTSSFLGAPTRWAAFDARMVESAPVRRITVTRARQGDRFVVAVLTTSPDDAGRLELLLEALAGAR